MEKKKKKEEITFKKKESAAKTQNCTQLWDLGIFLTARDLLDRPPRTQYSRAVPRQFTMLPSDLQTPLVNELEAGPIFFLHHTTALSNMGNVHIEQGFHWYGWLCESVGLCGLF